MTERAAGRVAPIGALALALLWPACAPAAGAGDLPTLTIGYLEVEGDPRYLPRPTYAGILRYSRGRPFDGAAAAVGEVRVLARALGVRFALARRTVDSAAGMVAAVEALRAAGDVRYFLVDADAGVVAELARRTRGEPLLLFNVSASDDGLRGRDCQAHLLNVVPSDAMLMDALAQYLAYRRWREVLVLEGPLPADRALSRVFERSAGRFGLDRVAVRDFVLSNDPRRRAESNVALLTSGEDYDVVFLADTDGEFGRYVPYRTSRPRPVVGTEGMIADTWHWAYERHGAPQLNQRFERHANRQMGGADWAAWAAVKSLVESVARTRSHEFEPIAAYLRSEAFRLDGYKGVSLSYRRWDNQLRQAIFLRTHNAVVGVAPFEGFLHATENLDTLGFDRPETRCRF